MSILSRRTVAIAAASFGMLALFGFSTPQRAAADDADVSRTQ
jgi:hypothetical protein